MDIKEKKSLEGYRIRVLNPFMVVEKYQESSIETKFKNDRFLINMSMLNLVVSWG